MEFTISPEVFERFPGLRVPFVVAQGIDNQHERPSVAAAWAATWAETAAGGGVAAGATRPANAQSHARVAPWRERFRALGVSGKEFPSSIEALLRRARRGGEPFRINPLVDFYNAVSLRHVAPAGGFDLAHVPGALELRLTRPGDHFTALDAEAPLAVPAGEVAYAVGTTVLTRHFVWRQSREALILPATRDVALLSEVLGELEPDTAPRLLDDLVSGLRRHFGVESRAWLVDAAAPRASWPG